MCIFVGLETRHTIIHIEYHAMKRYIGPFDSLDLNGVFSSLSLLLYSSDATSRNIRSILRTTYTFSSVGTTAT